MTILMRELPTGGWRCTAQDDEGVLLARAWARNRHAAYIDVVAQLQHLRAGS